MGQKLRCILGKRLLCALYTVSLLLSLGFMLSVWTGWFFTVDSRGILIFNARYYLLLTVNITVILITIVVIISNSRILGLSKIWIYLAYLLVPMLLIPSDQLYTLAFSYVATVIVNTLLYYYNLASDVDFDVYGWAAEKGEKNVAAVINAELKNYSFKITPVVVENAPVPMAYYDTIDTWGEGEHTASYQTRTYVMEHNGWFYELVFWLGEVEDGPAARDAGAVTAVENIMATLALKDSVDEGGNCNICHTPATAKPVGEFAQFVTKLDFKKDYNDRFGEEGDKITTINEKLSFNIEAIGDDAPAFASASYSWEVENGTAEISIDLPTPKTCGDYWYKLTETAGKTAGVEYEDNVYYIHLISAYVKGRLGFVSATIHTEKDDPNGDGDWKDAGKKTDTITNAYGEGELTINQTVSGNDAETTDAFEITVTLNAGTKDITGNINLDNGIVIEPKDWKNVDDNTICEIVVNLCGDESVTISGIPADVTYTVK